MSIATSRIVREIRHHSDLQRDGVGPTAADTQRLERIYRDTFAGLDRAACYAIMDQVKREVGSTPELRHALGSVEAGAVATGVRSVQPPTWDIARGDITGTIALVFVPTEHVESVLRRSERDLGGQPGGLALEPVHGAPSGHHPMWIGLDHLQNGRYAIEGVGHDVIAKEGGRLLGKAAGAASLFLLGPVGWYAGAKIGGALGELAGAATAKIQTATGTPYTRMFVGIPNVKRVGGNSLYTFTPPFHSNGYLSRKFDEWLGFGFNKRPAVFSGISTRNLSMADELGARMSSRIDSGDAVSPSSPSLSRFRELTSQQLLGLQDGRYAVSDSALEMNTPGVRVASATGTISAAKLPGMPDGDYPLGHFRDGQLASVVIENVPHMLSLPRKVTLGEL